MRTLAIAILLVGSVAFGQSEQRTCNAFVVVAADCNQHGTLFGGKTLAEMDRAAGIATRRFLAKSEATKDAVTVAINGFRFSEPAKVKDLVTVHARVSAAGKKSITVQVRACKELPYPLIVAEGEFVFVAYDFKDQKAVEHGLTVKKEKTK